MTLRFEEYEEFIYMNTHMTREEARAFARQCWNNGIEKNEALKMAREVK